METRNVVHGLQTSYTVTTFNCLHFGVFFVFGIFKRMVDFFMNCFVKDLLYASMRLRR